MKSPRNIDGVYFRVLRNGKYTNVCFSDMSCEEMDEVLKRLEKESLIELAKNLGNQLYYICEHFGIESEECR